MSIGHTGEISVLKYEQCKYIAHIDNWALARILGIVDVVASSLPVACLEVNSATAPTTMTASGTLC